MEAGSFVSRIGKKYLFDLFCLSFTPFFLSFAVKVVLSNTTGLLMEDYLLIFILLSCSLKGLIGSFSFFEKLKKEPANSVPFYIVSCEFLTSEVINFLLIHFLPYSLLLIFQDPVDSKIIILLTILCVVYYQWYSRTDLVLIIPFLLFGYGYYKVRYYYEGNEKQIRVTKLLIHRSDLKITNLIMFKIHNKLHVAFKNIHKIKLLK